MIASVLVSVALLIGQIYAASTDAFYASTTISVNATAVDLVRRQNGDPQYLFVFGDSYSNIGWDWQGRRPSWQNPIGNPAFPGSNICNCKIWVDYLTEDYHSNPTLTYDFANNCATVDHQIARCPWTEATDLIHQIQQWQEFRARTSVDLANAWVSNKALYALWFGANDAQYILDSAIDFKRTLILERYFEQINTLYSSGVRNFLIMGIPAIWRTPQVLEKPRNEQVFWERSTNDFNWFLYQKVLEWRRNHGDAKMVIADMKPLSEYVMNNPQSYGNPSCYGPGCLWVDKFHPGTELHRQFARCAISKLREQGLGQFFSEPNYIRC